MLTGILCFMIIQHPTCVDGRFKHDYCTRNLRSYVSRNVPFISKAYITSVASNLGVKKDEIGYMLKIVYKEDRFRSRIHRSGRHAGLFGQKLPTSPCIVEQIKWAINYCKRRYGSWKKAYAFHKKRNWW